MQKKQKDVHVEVETGGLSPVCKTGIRPKIKYTVRGIRGKYYLCSVKG